MAIQWLNSKTLIPIVNSLSINLKISLKHDILLHPRYFGPNLLDTVRQKLLSEVEGTCSGKYITYHHIFIPLVLMKCVYSKYIYHNSKVWFHYSHNNDRLDRNGYDSAGSRIRCVSSGVQGYCFSAIQGWGLRRRRVTGEQDRSTMWNWPARMLRLEALHTGRDGFRSELGIALLQDQRRGEDHKKYYCTHFKCQVKEFVIYRNTKINLIYSFVVVFK